MNTRFRGREKSEPAQKKGRKAPKLENVTKNLEMKASPAMAIFDTPTPKPRISMNQSPFAKQIDTIKKKIDEDQLNFTPRSISPSLPLSSQTYRVSGFDSDEEPCYAELKNVPFPSSMPLKHQQKTYHPKTEHYQTDENALYTDENALYTHENASYPDTRGFSLTNSLDGELQKFTTISEQMSKFWKEGNLLEFGRSIREGIKQKSLSNVQLEELAQNLDRPQIPMMQLLMANENANLEDLKSFNASYIFLHSMPPLHEKPIKRLQCSINAISNGINESSQQQYLEHRQLDHHHKLDEIGPFVGMDLNKFYMAHSLVGGGTVYQLTSVLVQLFKQVAQPKYEIWKFSFHPNSSKAVDNNFLALPTIFIEQIRDFLLDICGSYLPAELLTGPVDPNNEFVAEHLGDDYNAEIRRRRQSFGEMRKTIDQTVWQALRTVRSYHYNTETNELQSCSGRSNCAKHVKWEELKSLRHTKRASFQNEDEYTVTDIIAHAHSIRGHVKLDRRTRQNFN